MKIGFFGGSFNPPSNVHINLAKNVLQEFKLDKIMLVPVGSYYNKKELILEKHRFNMLKLATEDEPKIEIEDIALNSKNTLYAIDTFKLLRNKYKKADLFFIMGSDNFRKMPSWNNYDELINNYNIIVIERERQKVRKQDKKNIFEYIPNELYKIDSTKIRELIKNNKPVDIYLNNKVNKYIKDNNLYI